MSLAIKIKHFSFIRKKNQGPSPHIVVMVWSFFMLDLDIDKIGMLSTRAELINRKINTNQLTKKNHLTQSILKFTSYKVI